MCVAHLALKFAAAVLATISTGGNFAQMTAARWTDTLVDRLTRVIRSEGQTVGILAVDPTSPFSGGAILGDRIRMQSLYADGGVFIRSMATRGHLGGLSRATNDAIDLLDFRWEVIGCRHGHQPLTAAGGKHNFGQVRS